MTNNKTTLAALRRARNAKFDQICASIAIGHGEDPNPENLSDARCQQIEKEANKLVDDWDDAMMDNLNLKPKTKLQHLLAEHHEIGERILDRQDENCRRLGFFQDNDLG
jgi:hypothetical protein